MKNSRLLLELDYVQLRQKSSTWKTTYGGSYSMVWYHTSMVHVTLFLSPTVAPDNLHSSRYQGAFFIFNHSHLSPLDTTQACWSKFLHYLAAFPFAQYDKCHLPASQAKRRSRLSPPKAHASFWNERSPHWWRMQRTCGNSQPSDNNSNATTAKASNFDNN